MSTMTQTVTRSFPALRPLATRVGHLARAVQLAGERGRQFGAYPATRSAVMPVRGRSTSA